MVLSNKKLKSKIKETLSAKTTAEDTAVEAVQSLSEELAKKKKLRRQKKIKCKKEESSINGAVENKVTTKEENKTMEENKIPEENGLKRKRDAVENGNDSKQAKNKKKKKKKKKNNKEDSVSVKSEKTIEKKSEEAEKVEQQEEDEDDDIVINAGEPRVQTRSTSQIKDEYDPRKVYVGGIPYYSTEDDIHSFFESCGTITNLECMTFPDSGKFRGIALISFKTEEAAKRAIGLDGADMGGRFLKIQQCRSVMNSSSKRVKFEPATPTASNKVYLGNLDWNITEEDLRHLFEDCEIKEIRFGVDKNTEEFKGYAHAEFADEVSLAIALKLDQTPVRGRPIRISHALLKEDIKKEYADKDKSKSAKKKRRQTCFKCGEPGHISSACPAGESNNTESKEDMDNTESKEDNE